jgi:hypothetical protein
LEGKSLVEDSSIDDTIAEDLIGREEAKSPQLGY